MNNPKNLKLDISNFKSVGSEDDSNISYIRNLNLSEKTEDDKDNLLYNLSKNRLKEVLNERATSLGLEPETHFKQYPELRISTPNRRQAEISDHYYSSNFNPRYDKLTAGPRVKHNRKLHEFTAKKQGNDFKKKRDYQRERQKIETQIDLLKHIKSTRKKYGGRDKFKRKYKTKKNNKRKYRKKCI